MNKFLKKSLSVFLFVTLLIPSLQVLAADGLASSGGGGFAYPTFTTAVVGVGSGWEHGVEEHWHLSLVEEKSEFEVKEKVQFFAQVGPIHYDHQWSFKLYKNDTLDREMVNPAFTPDSTHGWNYSNFVPYELDLGAGAYRVEYLLEIYGVKKEIGNISFNVNLPEQDYVFDHATTSLYWEYGVDDEYWNLKPLGERDVFAVNDTVHLMVQVRDIYKTHRYKVELYRDELMLWDYVATWLDVGNGWQYSNFNPYYEKAQPGNYSFKTYIDTGDGYNELVINNFSVEGDIADYVYVHTYTASGWEHGEEEEYWNISATGISNEFAPGDTIYAVTQVKNIYVDHQWKVELLRSDDLFWEYEAPVNEVGNGWSYGNFLPFYSNAEVGEYEFKIYLATGGDYELIDSKSFIVRDVCANYTYFGLTIASNWEYGVGDEYYNLVPLGVTREFSQGDTVYALAKLKNVLVDHRWKAELYKYGELFSESETGILDVGDAWAYDVYNPFFENAEIGNYEFKIYLDIGDGFELLDTANFGVK